MASLQEISGYFVSGQGRLIAAAILFVLMWGLKNVPLIGRWLKSNTGWLTAARKKTVANVVLAMAPAAVMLADPTTSINDVLWEAVLIAFAAAGIHGKLRAFVPKKDDVDKAA